MITDRHKEWFHCCSRVTQSLLLFYTDVDFSGGEVEGVEPALHEESPLQAEGGDQEVEAHAAEAVALQEGHEETEPNEDHDVDVLEALEGRKEKLKFGVQTLNKNMHFYYFWSDHHYGFISHYLRYLIFFIEIWSD